MKRKMIVGCLLLTMSLVLSGCIKEQADRENLEIPKVEENTEVAEDETEDVSGDATTDAETDEMTAGVGEGTTYTFEEITITFPEAWEDRYVIVEYEDGSGISVHQKLSYDVDGSGVLFGVWKNNEPAYDHAGASPLAYTEDMMYFMSYPTDVQFNPEVEGAFEDYEELCTYCDWIRENIVITGEGVHTNADEYIMPMSEYYPLEEYHVINFDANQLMLARNEIYARHGYHFKNEYLNLYFDRYSWYEDKGDSFDESQLSEIEKDNVDLIKEMESRLSESDVYPEQCWEYATGKAVHIDLDGDGDTEEIIYEVKDYAGIFRIDGEVYKLEDMVRIDGDGNIYMSTPDEEYFYIADVSPHFDGKELVVTDDGPSDDPVSHFFIYEDGQLQHIGTVLGYPMKQKAWLNGFNSGGVTGYARHTCIETHECYVYYWYNYDERRLEYQDISIYRLLPKPPKSLTMDLQVYTTNDTATPTITLKAQEKVYFMMCDCTGEWILVRGKDGTEGWVHLENDLANSGDYIVDGVNKPANEVFVGLQYYD